MISLIFFFTITTYRHYLFKKIIYQLFLIILSKFYYLHFNIFYIVLFFRGPKWKEIERYSLAADSISIGDIVNAKIRSTNNWSLLPTQVFAFYLPYNKLE